MLIMVAIFLLAMIVMMAAAESPMVLTKITQRAVMDDAAVAQDHSAVKKAGKRPDLVQHNQHTSAGPQQSGQHLDEHPLLLEVNSRGGLIQDQKIWLARKRPGDQHPLLLAVRQSRNVRVETVGQSDQSDGVVDGVSIGRAQWSEHPPACQPSRSDDLFHL